MHLWKNILTTATLSSLMFGSINTSVKAQAQQVNLNGTWIATSNGFTFEEDGCSPGYSGQTTVDDKIIQQGSELDIMQTGDKISLPNRTVKWFNRGNSGEYDTSSRGTVSGYTINIETVGSGKLGIQKDEFIIESTGTISEDGNTIAGQYLCRIPGTPRTASGSFKWVRKSSLNNEQGNNSTGNNNDSCQLEQNSLNRELARKRKLEEHWNSLKKDVYRYEEERDRIKLEIGALKYLKNLLKERASWPPPEIYSDFFDNNKKSPNPEDLPQVESISDEMIERIKDPKWRKIGYGFKRLNVLFYVFVELYNARNDYNRRKASEAVDIKINEISNGSLAATNRKIEETWSKLEQLQLELSNMEKTIQFYQNQVANRCSK
jgi:hypothetical protein